MVIIMDISSDKHIKDFFIKRDISNTNTQRTYLIRLRKYCELTNKTPTELIKEAIEEEDQRLRNERTSDTRNIYLILKNFFKMKGVIQYNKNIYGNYNWVLS